MNNLKQAKPTAPDEPVGKTGRTDQKLAELAELANARLFNHGLFFFSSPHIYTKIIKSFKGTSRVAVSKCTEILKNFFP